MKQRDESDPGMVPIAILCLVVAAVALGSVAAGISRFMGWWV